MNIANLMPRFNRSQEPTEAQLNAEDEQIAKDKKANTPKHGPQRIRHLSEGRVQRLIARDKATRKRRDNARYRRSWMANQHQVARLRGQLETVGAVENGQGRYSTTASSEALRGAHEHLEATYGSVDAATEHYNDILAGR